MITGKKLKEKWNVQVHDAKYRKTGDWYHPLKIFPAAYFDQNGYIIFNNQEEYVKCPFLQIKKDVHIPLTISSIPGYISVENNSEQYTEGKIYNSKLTRYERDAEAREKCLEYYGYSCIICGFNFEKKYGKMAKKIIHVHHLTPLSDIKKSHVINPIKDLRPVCPNCHIILHLNRPPLSIEAVKKILQNDK